MKSVVVLSDTAYVTYGLHGVGIIDVSDPTSPKQIGLYDTGDEATDVFVVGNTIYVADGNDGVYIIRFGLPTNIVEEDLQITKNFVLKQNYPNPFNPSTTIEFTLPVAQRVILEIYDISGQLVKTLIDALKPAGIYKVDWDGTNEAGEQVASGVYFYRLRTENFHSESTGKTFIQTRKMMLVH